jgi:hypothetical protein
MNNVHMFKKFQIWFINLFLQIYKWSEKTEVLFRIQL